MSCHLEAQRNNEKTYATISNYSIYLKKLSDPDDVYCLTASNWFGECYSGWCDAFTGELSDIEVYKDVLPPIHYRLKPTYLNQFQLQIAENGNQILVNTDGNVILTCTGNGGDGYYPCGHCELDETYLDRSPRCPTKRPVYVFSGQSGLGKSYLSSFCAKQLDVYETDQHENIPEDVWIYDVIVVGNRYSGQMELVKQQLSQHLDDIKVVDVLLSSISD